jgi:hypothetical protein
MVNRLWRHHFGKGLWQRRAIGVRGMAPTHPELLDYLATRFIERTVHQAMHREMMLGDISASQRGKPANQEVDASNDFLWRFSRQRLDAESCGTRCSYQPPVGIRSGGPHPFPNMGTWVYMQHDPFNAVYPSIGAAFI